MRRAKRLGEGARSAIDGRDWLALASGRRPSKTVATARRIQLFHEIDGRGIDRGNLSDDP